MQLKLWYGLLLTNVLEHRGAVLTTTEVRRCRAAAFCSTVLILQTAAMMINEH